MKRKSLVLSVMIMFVWSYVMPSTASAGCDPSDTYTITATAGTGGMISPSGSISVEEGDNQSFTIAANSGYQIQEVRVDNISQGAISSYTFYNVQSGHTISATFVVQPSQTRVDVSSPDVSKQSLPDNHYQLTMPNDPSVFNKFKNVTVDVRLTTMAAPLKPESVRITNPALSLLTCKWTESSSPQATGYVLQVHYSVADPAFCFSNAPDIEQTVALTDPNLSVSGNEYAYQVSGIDPTAYYRCVRVRATNQNGSSGFSETNVTQKPPPSPAPPVRYTLTVTTVGSGSGMVTKTPDQADYAQDDVVTLNAIPAQGSQFGGWSGGLAGTQNPTNITMNGNQNVTAAFYIPDPPDDCDGR